LGTLGDIFTSKTLTGSEITLLDINAKALDVVLQTTKDFIQSHGLRYTLRQPPIEGVPSSVLIS
jgi:alpha-galactosidase